MSTFAEIAAEISTEINQGDTLDAIILTKVYEAHRTMENNYTFHYMNVERTIDQPADDLAFLFTLGTKRVEMIRYDYEGEFRYLWQVHPTDPLKPETDRPQFWYLLSVINPINLVNTPSAKLFLAFSEETTLTVIESIRRQSYTQGGTDWLTQQGHDAIKNAALVLMAAPARDPELGQLYSVPAQLTLNTVMALDEELGRSMEDPEIRFS